ncbi:tripartite tricarboxylate transporter substrate binding protein [Pusillimonas sp. SM2304]|uniref:Bug family tripartite tricarboxylate transporter substrate binding protein n=1 Tax=Pusillimonas sp. SM2304 TaxID=3073241 RepID=UPI0028767994|nr:tripartite tricarboxylate transporter substrate binding protein [Pusillimonas sp. SM2304]MDS1139932.1 tripartite tricarboxylate transporter substrate binding protein [Pusillimonas sp. SM2304]
MKTTRRKLLMGLGLGFPMLAAGMGKAWAYPDRPIKIVVPYPTGSSLEVIARVVAESYLGELGSPAIVFNMPGGSAAIGTRSVAQSAPDGYTLLLGTNQTHGANSALYPKLGYDPVQDFIPIAGLGRLQHLLVARKDLGVDTLDAFVELVRSRSGDINYGSSGNGSASHLAAEMFKRSAGVDMQHIPYKGSGDVVQAIMGGHIDAAFSTMPTVLAQVRNGDLIALAVASATRSPSLPDIPTLTEKGILNAEADAWSALFAPKGTPPQVIEKLAATTLKTFSDPAVIQRIAATGFIPEITPQQAFREFLLKDMQNWADIIRDANITVD